MHIREKLWHVGCKPEGIRKRGHVLSDYLHQDWNMMQIYRLQESPKGSPLVARTQVFEVYADRIFVDLYPGSEDPPRHLIHVTCTGYVSPSGAQKIVSLHGWGEYTNVTHAYHMGCYGSLPALRMAQGFLAIDGGRADIVHTEMCSLHVQPSLHTEDQLVTQSLFADGFIKYSMENNPQDPYLHLHVIHEEILPGSIGSMSWKVSDFGFTMFLAKEIPVLIKKCLDQFLMRLCKKANRFPEKIMSDSLFAIHPGGPKILQFVKKHFQLRESQMIHSLNVLQEYGNMSSSTLPHIWKSILEDDSVSWGTQILTIAFGPGLTISGALMEKCHAD